MEMVIESPRSVFGARAVSKAWTVTDRGVEIATITMSITMLSGFQEGHIERLLNSMANDSHSFYLELENMLKTKIARQKRRTK